MSRVTTKDEKQPSGVVMRCFYVDGKQVSRLLPDSIDWELHRRELEQRYGTRAEQALTDKDVSQKKRGRPTGPAAVAARQAPAVDPALVQPPKSKERLAREELYGACLAQNVKFDAADALALEVGVVEATSLIRAHGAESAWVSMTSRFWALTQWCTSFPGRIWIRFIL